MGRGRVARRHQPALAWLIPALALILDLGTAVALPHVRLPPSVALPGWAPFAGPLLVYTLVACVGLRGVLTAQTLVGAISLLAVHTLLTLANGALYSFLGGLRFSYAVTQAIWESPAVQLLQLVWAPLALFPFRGVLLPVARHRRRQRIKGHPAATTWVPTARGVTVIPPRRPVQGRPRTPEPRASQDGEVVAPKAPPTPARREPVPEPAPRVLALPEAAVTLPLVQMLPPLAAEPDARSEVVALAERSEVIFEVTAEELAARLEPALSEMPELVEPVVHELEWVQTPDLERPVTATAFSTAQVEEAVADWIAPEIEEVPSAIPVEVPLWPRPDYVVQLRELAAVFAPFAPLLSRFGPLEADAQTADDATLFTVFPPRLAKEALVRVAVGLLPALADGGNLQVGDSIDQVTLRGSEGVLVVTPLRPVDRGGPVLVTGGSRRGAMALLEMLSDRAAAGYRNAHPDPVGPGAPTIRSGRHQPGLDESAVPHQLDRLAGNLDAFGPVTPSALREARGALAFYLFAAPGTEAAPLAQLARDVYRAVEGVSTEPGGIGPLESVALRLGSRRAIFRPVGVTAGASTLLVAAGGVARPGLAHFQLERVAARLVAPAAKGA